MLTQERYDLLILVDDAHKIVWKDTPLSLEKADGTGKYAGIITTTNNFVYQVSNQITFVCASLIHSRLMGCFKRSFMKLMCCNWKTTGTNIQCIATLYFIF